MKKEVVKMMLFLSMSLFFFSCGEKVKEDETYDPRYPETAQITKEANDILALADNVFMRNNSLVELYTQENNSNELKLVPNFEHVSSNLKAIYNIIKYKDGQVMYVAEFPFSASNDWENIYESIFDERGNLILFVRKSSFLSDKKIVREKSEYFYDESHRLLKKTYLIVDAQDKPIPEDVKINFSARFPYEKCMTRKDWLESHAMSK